jgi:hypothetical protein
VAIRDAGRVEEVGRPAPTGARPVIRTRLDEADGPLGILAEPGGKNAAAAPPPTTIASNDVNGATLPQAARAYRDASPYRRSWCSPALDTQSRALKNRAVRDQSRAGPVSPALVISLVALFVALGGTGYAAFTVGSRDIKTGAVGSRAVKNGSLKGKDLKLGTVGGREVNEGKLDAGKLGLVANASHASSADVATTAGSATTAANATTVGGVTVMKIAVSDPIPSTGTTTTTLFDLAGLKVVETCTGTGSVIDLQATAHEPGIIKASGQQDQSPLTPWAATDPNFLPTSPALDVNQAAVPENSEGELWWQTQTGKALTFTYLSEVNAFGGVSNCTVGGTVIAG